LKHRHLIQSIFNAILRIHDKAFKLQVHN